MRHLSTAIVAVALAALLPAGAAHAEKTYSSVRDCMRDVAAAEREVDRKGPDSSAGRLVAQARDLCMQARYEGAQDAVSKIREEGGAD